MWPYESISFQFLILKPKIVHHVDHIFECMSASMHYYELLMQLMSGIN